MVLPPRPQEACVQRQKGLYKSFSVFFKVILFCYIYILLYLYIILLYYIAIYGNGPEIYRTGIV